MKRKNHRNVIVVTALLLVVGIVVGSLPFGDTTIARAAANFLETVAHDATLSGNGTSASPLGIANSGVGTSQLANNSVIGPKIAPGQVVTSVNNLRDDVTLAAGSNVTITPDGNTLTIASNSPQQPYINPLRVATLQWYEANQNGLMYSVGAAPFGVAFDGANIWVTNFDDNTVTKLRASDGINLGTFATGLLGPRGIAFDGANIWVVSTFSSAVTKLRASDGVTLGTFSMANDASGIAFDGANIWIASRAGNSVTKLRASDGVTLGTFSVGSNPFGVAFDGANIWVANGSDSTVTKLRASDGVIVGIFAVNFPRGIAFDGANIWVASSPNAVRKLRASDGANLGTFSVGSIGSTTLGVAFDGANIWVVSSNSSAVTKLRASDGANLGTFAVGVNPQGIAFDGANMWVALFSGGIRKL